MTSSTTMSAPRFIRALCLAALLPAFPAAASAQMIIDVADYAAAPITGRFGASGNASALARLNFVRPEPASTRLFVNDLNGPLYIVDPVTRAFTKYLDLNGRGAASGIFKRFSYAIDLGNGFVTFQFDPDYPRNGKFYTIHIEEQALTETAMPDPASVPGLRVDGYQPTPAVPVPGASEREVVLVEWTDTNTADAIFEGSAREVLRMEINTHLHPPTDLIFNPTATPGDADWRVMYMASGDGGAGEQTDIERRNSPQRLDTLVGKILRIIPDPAAHVKTSVPSANGRYRIPRDNPFVTSAGARAEIWAVGFRNPHRLTWAVDPAHPSRNRLLVLSVGLSDARQVSPTMRPVVAAGYESRRRLEAAGQDTRIPGRADIRLALDSRGELLVVSKIDGVLREVTAAEIPSSHP